MNCLRCSCEFHHCPVKIYWCSEACWQDSTNREWSILPEGPGSIAAPVKLTTKAHYLVPNYKRKCSARKPTDLITIGKKTMTMAAWARNSDLNYTTVYHRIKKLKWHPARAISAPVVRA